MTEPNQSTKLAREKMRWMVVEDNAKLRPALIKGLEDTGGLEIPYQCASGEAALEYLLDKQKEVQKSQTEASAQTPGISGILMDVQLEGKMNGIEAAVAIRREFPRLPVVFYSIQDDDNYFRAFRNSGILSHYAYVKKSNYLLPSMILPLMREARDGRGFIDPEIEERVQEVVRRDKNSPLDLLESNERVVAGMLAAGLGNEQIARRLGFRDKRSISRINGQIYSTWGLNETASDEKVARTRAVLIIREGRMIAWEDDGTAQVEDSRGEWVDWNP